MSIGVQKLRSVVQEGIRVQRGDTETRPSSTKRRWSRFIRRLPQTRSKFSCKRHRILTRRILKKRILTQRLLL